jgi:hypothetical protein
MNVGGHCLHNARFNQRDFLFIIFQTPERVFPVMVSLTVAANKEATEPRLGFIMVRLELSL